MLIVVLCSPYDIHICGTEITYDDDPQIWALVYNDHVYGKANLSVVLI